MLLPQLQKDQLWQCSFCWTNISVSCSAHHYQCQFKQVQQVLLVIILGVLIVCTSLHTCSSPFSNYKFHLQSRRWPCLLLVIQDSCYFHLIHPTNYKCKNVRIQLRNNEKSHKCFSTSIVMNKTQLRAILVPKYSLPGIWLKTFKVHDLYITKE